MSEVTLQIGGHPYTVSCAEGQESHIEMLGEKIQVRLDSMDRLAPQRSQNLLFAALFLADDLHEAEKASASTEEIASELTKLRAAKKDAETELQEIKLARDALLSERDTMRADHDAIRAKLADSETQIAQLRESTATTVGGGSDDLDLAKLTILAEALEKSASELEQRASAP